MLRAEAEKDDASLPQTDFSKRDLTSQLVLAEQPARAQYVLLRIARDDADVRTGSG